MSYHKAVWSGGVGAIASEPTRFGQVTVRGDLGEVNLGTKSSYGSGTTTSGGTLTALGAAARAATDAAIRAKRVYDAAEAAYQGAWRLPPLEAMKRKRVRDAALLVFRAATAKAQAATAAAVAERMSSSWVGAAKKSSPMALVQRTKITAGARASVRAEAAAAEAPPPGSSGGGSGGASGGGSSGGGSGGASGGGGATSYGGGDPDVPPVESPTGPPVEMPETAPVAEKKPMSGAVKVGLLAAGGFILYSMFGGTT